MKILKTFILAWAITSMAVAQERTVGIMLNGEETFNGYTLFSPHGNTSIYLINNCGEKVHEWYSTYFPGVSVYLTEDGSLYRAGKTSGTDLTAGGAGGIVEKFDWDGNLVWQYEYSTSQYRQHHDFQVLPNGNVLLLAWELKTSEEALAAGRNPSLITEDAVWPEHVVEIKPTGSDGGEMVWEWHVWDHLVQDFDETKANYGSVSENINKIDLNFTNGGEGKADWIHANALNYNPDLNQIMISTRVFDELWVIDHNTTTEEAKGAAGDLIYRWGNPMAYKMGTEEDRKLFGQHNTHWIPAGLPDAGKIMVFNNGINRLDGKYTSIVKIDPAVSNEGRYNSDQGRFLPTDYDWEYVAPTPTDFYSWFISGAQQLPNGNILIDDGAHGTFFEINAAGEMVWKYINPITIRGALSQGDDIIPEGGTNPDNFVFRAIRYPHNYVGFSGKDLSSQGQLEQNPTAFDCQLVTSVVEEQLSYQIYPNPVSDYLNLDMKNYERKTVELVNFSGQVLVASTVIGQGQLDVVSIKSGVYVLKVEGERPTKIVIQH
ncbi:MAG: aryl-sulfate sulfotransferase [Reichenbachiella sp.]|uniref:aryl-sulfate sulfotransferase n=2 Tax=Reichenbachiella sp. TaxID=2184521 RepID=UPI003266D812